MKRLWWLTGLAILILLVATVALFIRADRLEESGIMAYVTKSQSAPFLRDQPGNNGAVLSVLEYGASVRVRDSATRDYEDWYFVDNGQVTGWLLASLVSFDPPENAVEE